MERMNTVTDYLIVGAGITGCTLAERLANVLGKKVLLIEQRPHIGGNVYDAFNADGILVHQYGPHIFHTWNEEVWSYLSRFTHWIPYQHRVLAWIDDQLVPFPINIETINRLYELQLNESTIGEFYRNVRIEVKSPRNSEEIVISAVGRDLYEKFFKNYTKKQWGVYPCDLAPEVTARIPYRQNRDDRYFNDSYQGIPLEGYTKMIERMLDSPKIEIRCNTSYREIQNLVRADRVIYTGTIDGYFNYCLGALPYRSLQFRFETLETPFFQPVAVVNYPNDHNFTRITEYKHLTGQEHPRTTISKEYPCSNGDPFYPVPTPVHQALYMQYSKLATSESHILFCGRLGRYRYLNMDEAVSEALALFKLLCRQQGIRQC